METKNKKDKTMKKNGFTLIEILISLVIIAALASISIPAIYNNVMKIEQASTVESAMNGLRQLFVDARAKSLKNEEAFTITNATTTSLTSIQFTGNQTNEIIYYSLPAGMRTKLTMTIPIGTYSYLLGMFLEDNTTDSVYEIEENYFITIELEDNTTVGTLTIDKGIPITEYLYE
jgi:prepilin-type N-terminal cleavage/methylation domain-containing protein